jgi:hypothetical protein
MTTRIDALREALEQVASGPCDCPEIEGSEGLNHYALFDCHRSKANRALLTDDQAAAREVPRRPAREVVHEAIGCHRGAEFMGAHEFPHDSLCDRLTAAIEADRAATP